jgi:hypothetical protein
MPANTAGQPIFGPMRAAHGAASVREASNPETTIARWVPRRPNGALPPASAYTEGETPAAAAPASSLAPSNQAKLPATAVSRLAMAKTPRQQTRIRRRPTRSPICPSKGAPAMYTSANTVTHNPAVAAATAKLAAICGSNGETTKRSLPITNIVSQPVANLDRASEDICLSRAQPVYRQGHASSAYQGEIKEPLPRSRTSAGRVGSNCFRPSGIRD